MLNISKECLETVSLAILRRKLIGLSLPEEVIVQCVEVVLLGNFADLLLARRPVISAHHVHRRIPSSPVIEALEEHAG